MPSVKPSLGRRLKLLDASPRPSLRTAVASTRRRLLLRELYWAGMAVFALIALIVARGFWSLLFWAWFVLSFFVASSLDLERRRY